MAKIKSILIKCGYCDAKFPPFFFCEDTETLHSFITSGNRQKCPKCQQIVNCNKDNISYLLEDGTGGGVWENYSGNITTDKGDPRISHPPAPPQDPFAIARRQLAEYRKKNGKEY